MSIPSQVTHNLKCPPELPSISIFSSRFMHNSKCLPQDITIHLDFLVSIHGSLAPSGSPRPLFPHCLIPLGLSRPRYSPLLGLPHPSLSAIILQFTPLLSMASSLPHCFSIIPYSTIIFHYYYVHFPFHLFLVHHFAFCHHPGELPSYLLSLPLNWQMHSLLI